MKFKQFSLPEHKQLAGSIFDKNDAQKVLGDDLYFNLLEKEPETLLDKTLFGFFERCFRCFTINRVLTKYGYSLNFLRDATCIDFLSKKSTGKKLSYKKSFCLCH